MPYQNKTWQICLIRSLNSFIFIASPIFLSWCFCGSEFRIWSDGPLKNMNMGNEWKRKAFSLQMTAKKRAIWHVPCTSICHGLQGILYNCTPELSYLQFLPRSKHLLFIFLSLKLMQFHCSFIFGYFLLHPKLFEVPEDKGEDRTRPVFISKFERKLFCSYYIKKICYM